MNNGCKRQYAVEKTNDSSIVSKASIVEKGYINDHYLKHFVKKVSCRSSLINRGYYIRAKAMEYVLKKYFETVTSVASIQVISLGAGFDSSYFRLKSNNGLPANTRYYEVDFPSVIKRKISIIESDNILLDLIGDYTTDSSSLSSACYKMLSCDLRNLDILKSKLMGSGIDFSSPTLFISECAITYMEEKDSSALIQFSALNFQTACFAMYEQVYPCDGFGIVMKQHFEKIGSPLKSIDKYQDPDSHKERFISLGWPETTAMDMNTFYSKFIDAEEKLRIRKLEVFDEYEELHLKYSHYVLVIATKGSLLKPMAFKPFQDKPKYSRSCLKCEAPVIEAVHRFGHSSNIVGNEIISIGGFGDDNGFHKRISNLSVLNTKSLSENSSNFISKDFNLDRLFHRTVEASDKSIIILGGRFCPTQAPDKIFRLEPQFFHDGGLSAVNIECIGKWTHEIPSRWRHSSSLITSKDGVDHIYCFGGISASGNVLCDFVMFDLNSKIWTLMESQLPARHSHSSCVWNQDKILIAGGLSKEEVPMNSIDLFCTSSNRWEKISIAGILPRYSHTSNVYGDKLFLVGGVNSDCANVPGLAVVDLVSKTCIEYELPVHNIKRPLLLHKHSTVLIENHLVTLGGGGNCFSFGTHLNSCTLRINCEEIIQSELS